jgi:hypothetical protein
MADYENGKLLYHLTDIKNLESILAGGLKARSELAGFTDVADSEILEKRKKLKLEEQVPFHFFGGGPFDGGVQLANKESQFVLLAVTRAHAKANNWKIIPSHPLSDDDIELMDYEKGFTAIDWTKMNERDYTEQESKNSCMAECLSPNTVSPERIYSIFVKDKVVEGKVRALLDSAGLSPFLNANLNMFVK